MSIIVGEDTRLCVSGITGREGQFHTLNNRAYGTQVVSGVTPGKGGQDVDGIAVYDSVAEAVEATGATASFVALRCNVSLPSDAAPSSPRKTGDAEPIFVPGVIAAMCAA